MDLQKERELFLAHMRSIGSAGFMFELDEDGNFDDMSMAYAWSAWQAKAQAVPEGFVLVPKEPTPKMIDSTWDYDDEIYGMSSNERNRFIYKAMIEAQEQAND